EYIKGCVGSKDRFGTWSDDNVVSLKKLGESSCFIISHVVTLVILQFAEKQPLKYSITRH
ncbi:MAG TPA: hypothetical protein PK951_15990, partial [Chitinophagaceae bacterium]|nr:hypothetical protein [Chitinophagaceae bacterium]